MKVDRNQNYQSHQVRTIEPSEDDNFAVERIATVGGIPLRLEIASRCMAAMLAGRFTDCDTDTPYTVLCLGGDFMWNDVPDGPQRAAKLSLEAADALIEAHNATCGEAAGE